MPVGILVAVVLLLVFAGAIWLTFSLLGLLVTIVVAAIVGWVADRIVPGELPYGWLGAIAAGLAGTWLGSMVMGQFGPVVAGIPLLPALLGAIVIAFAAEIITKRMRARKTTRRAAR